MEIKRHFLLTTGGRTLASTSAKFVGTLAPGGPLISPLWTSNLVVIERRKKV